jgi:hypothetical protein
LSHWDLLLMNVVATSIVAESLWLLHPCHLGKVANSSVLYLFQRINLQSLDIVFD